MDEANNSQQLNASSQLWRDSIDENMVAENQAQDEMIEDMQDPSPVRKNRGAVEA